MENKVATMTISDIVMILAVVAAPFLAVYAQSLIDLRREKHGRKLLVFKTLMATRGTVLSPEHVQALNMISLEFTGKRWKSVIDAWKEYRDHLSSFPREGESLEQKQAGWHEKTADYLTKLLQSMGEGLKYDFDAVEIKKGAYSPEAYGNAEIETLMLRRRLIDWLVQNNPVTVSVVPVDEEARNKGEKHLLALLDLVNGKKPLRVAPWSEESEESIPIKNEN